MGNSLMGTITNSNNLDEMPLNNIQTKYLQTKKTTTIFIENYNQKPLDMYNELSKF